MERHVSGQYTLVAAVLGALFLVPAYATAQSQAKPAAPPAAKPASPDSAISQFASSATASSEYSDDGFSASQAVGAPNVSGCADDQAAWASQENSGVEWLEVKFATPVVPTQIDIHEVYSPGSIGKVEVKLASGQYATVYSTKPGTAQTCPRILSFPVSGVTEKISVVKIHIDQSALQDWNEIDAVKLVGKP